MAHMESAHAKGTCSCVDYVEKCICDDTPHQGESHDLKCCLQEQRRMAFLHNRKKYRYGQNVRVRFPSSIGKGRWTEATYLEPDKERRGFHRVDQHGIVWSIPDEDCRQ